MRKTPAELLAEIGQSLHGSHWQWPLARDLDVDRKSIQRWINRHTPLAASHGVFDDARELLLKRRDELGAMADVLERWMQDQRKLAKRDGD